MRPSAAPAATDRRGIRLTSEGLAWFAAAAVLGTLGWLKSLNLLLVLAYIMLALLALNGVLARTHARRVRANRIPLPPLFAGEETRTTIKVRNESRKPATVAVLDGSAAWNVERLPAGEAVECTETRRHLTRGRKAAAPLVVRSGFPFGFLQYDRVEESADALVVLPALGHVDADVLRRWLLRQAGSEGRSRKVLRRVTTDLADVRGVRPYRPGDSIRAVHWRSSARRRELMVREYDAAPSPDLLVVVEPWLPAEPSAADYAGLEAALSLAATMIRAWCRTIETGATLVVAGDDTTVGTAQPGEASVREALIPLADVIGAVNFASIAPSAFGRALLRAARVVVSSRPNSPLAAELARSTGKPFFAVDPSLKLPWYRER